MLYSEVYTRPSLTDLLPQESPRFCEGFLISWAGVAPKGLARRYIKMNAYAEGENSRDVRVQFNPSERRANVVIPQVYFGCGIA